MKVIIGGARFEDGFRIIRLLESGRSEVGMGLPYPDQPYAIQQLLDYIGRGYVFVARLAEDGEIVGVLILEPQKLWYKAAPHYIQSLEFYVDPEFRKGGTAKLLLKRGIKVANVAGVPLIVSVTSGGMAEMKDRFIERQGFSYIGGNLVYEPDGDLLEAEEATGEEDSPEGAKEASPGEEEGV